MIRSIARLFPKSCLTAFVMYPAIFLLSSIPAFAGKVTITSPSTNASYPGTITVTATGSESVPFFYQLWDNGKKLGNVFSTSVNSSFTLPAGSHTLTVLTSTPSGRVLDSSSVVYQISSGSEYVWTAPKVGSVASLGTISYSSGSESAEVLSPKVLNNGAFVCTAVSAPSIQPGQSLAITYRAGAQALVITVALAEANHVLTASLSSNLPLVQNIDLGNLSENLGGSLMTVPYYSSQIVYLSSKHLFANAWWDWHNSGANAVDSSLIMYHALTDGSRKTMHESFSLAISSTLSDVLPRIGNAPSPYLAKLAGRTVVDIWALQSFEQVQADISNLNDYGLNNCVYLMHDWQHQGYDNGLPGHYPANTDLGGSAAIHNTVLEAEKSGCFAGLHQNYMDYYPNYAGFTSKALGVDAQGDPVPTWLNGEGIQAHETKPSWMLNSAQSQSPHIHVNLQTDAAFIDVNSATNPWSRLDFDASAAGEGSSSSWMNNATALWKYERTTEGGPVFGEGSEHWYYSGLLDGVEAQMGAGSLIRINNGPSIPLFVDFDVLRIHPLQVNHGMGYYKRWMPNAAGQMTAEQLDQYRMQEIIFGHAPYVDSSYWNDIFHATIESGLVGPVAKNYGTALATQIQYQVDGNWVASETAAPTGSFSRVKVDYDSGLEVIANSQAQPLVAGDVELPQYGWSAKGDGINAFTAMCGSVVCDYAESPTSVFANARNPKHMISAGLYAQPSFTNFSQVGDGRFTFTLVFDSIRPYLGAAIPFVHFVKETGSSVSNGYNFQGAGTFLIPMADWHAGQIIKDAPKEIQLPSGLADGNYSVRIGIADPTTGLRLPLMGNDDGTKRIIAGTITVSGGGSRITYAAAPAAAATYADLRGNAAGQVLTFPTLKTDSLVSIAQQSGRWVLRSYPVGVPATILLKTSKFPVPSSVQTDLNENLSVTSDGEYWQVTLGGAKDVSWPVTQ